MIIFLNFEMKNEYPVVVVQLAAILFNFKENALS